MGALLAPDGSSVAAVDVGGNVRVYSAETGQPRPVAGLERGDVPLTWDPSSRALLVWNRTFPIRVFRIDVAAGRRQLVREIAPGDPAGVLYGTLTLTADAQHYLYRIRRVLSGLYVVNGLR